MDRPDIRYGTITLHLSPHTRFRRRFGDKVDAVGGKWSNTYGDAVTRYVTVPASQRDLIDRIAMADRKAGLTHIVLGDFTDKRFDKVARSSDKMLSWHPEMDSSISAFVEREFERIMTSERYDWKVIQETWRQEEEDALKRNSIEAMIADHEDLRDKILGEAMRILDGANDIDTLKSLARRYRDLCDALGLPTPQPEPMAD